MSKRRQRENSKRADTGLLSRSAITFHRLEAPFEVPDSKREEFRKHWVSASRQTFDDDISKLDQLMLETNPLNILAMLSFRFLLSVSPLINKNAKSEIELAQHHIEFLQAFVLRHSWNDFKKRPLDPRQVAELLQSVSLMFFFKRLGTEKPTDAQEKARARLIEEVRLYTQAVRNPTYHRQMMEVLHGIAKTLDRGISGASIAYDTIIDFLESLIELYDLRLAGFAEALFEINQAADKHACFEAFEKHVPLAFWAQEKIEYLKGLKISFRKLREALSAVAFDHLMFIYTLDISIAKSLIPEYEDQVERILDAWSLEFASLSDFQTEHIFMANPIANKPIIKLDSGHYYIPIPGLLVSNAEAMLKSLAISDGVQRRYEESRSQFLEELIAERMKMIFGSANALSGSKWSRPTEDAEYENDILVLYDSVSLIIEAKSGAIAPSARRGGERVFTEIRELVSEPAQQGLRFAEYLRDYPGPHQFATKRGVINKVDARSIRISIVLPVTMEELSARWNSGLFLEAGLINKEELSCPPIYIGDLLPVIEILNTLQELLHYFKFRSEFAKNGHVMSDELDLLAFYLDGERLLPQASDGKEISLVGLTGLSDNIDRYFYAAQRGDNTSKPSCRRTPWFDSLIRQASKDTQPGWTETMFQLLDVPISFQHDAELRRDELIALLKNSSEEQGCKSAISNPGTDSHFSSPFLYTRISRSNKSPTSHTIVL